MTALTSTMIGLPGFAARSTRTLRWLAKLVKLPARMMALEPVNDSSVAAFAAARRDAVEAELHGGAHVEIAFERGLHFALQLAARFADRIDAAIEIGHFDFAGIGDDELRRRITIFFHLITQPVAAVQLVIWPNVV